MLTVAIVLSFSKFRNKLQVSLQRNRTISMEIYYEELAHVTMEAKKPCGLPSASWGISKASGVIYNSAGLKA